MISIEDIKKFVYNDYAQKDEMHDLNHINGIIKVGLKIYSEENYNQFFFIAGAFFHGIIYNKEDQIREFLEQKGLHKEEIEKITQIARESQTDGVPETIEGKMLHDAHLLEGGKTFIITKSLITGTLRGQSLAEIITFIEENVLGKFKCYLPKSKSLYEEKERFAREYIQDLKSNMPNPRFT